MRGVPWQSCACQISTYKHRQNHTFTMCGIVLSGSTLTFNFFEIFVFVLYFPPFLEHILTKKTHKTLKNELNCDTEFYLTQKNLLLYLLLSIIKLQMTFMLHSNPESNYTKDLNRALLG